LLFANYFVILAIWFILSFRIWFLWFSLLLIRFILIKHIYDCFVWFVISGFVFRRWIRVISPWWFFVTVLLKLIILLLHALPYLLPVLLHQVSVHAALLFWSLAALSLWSIPSLLSVVRVLSVLKNLCILMVSDLSQWFLLDALRSFNEMALS